MNSFENQTSIKVKDGPNNQVRSGFGDFYGNVKQFEKPVEDKEYSKKYQNTLDSR